MKLNRELSPESIERALRLSSELEYGSGRTEEISEQIRHLSAMLYELSQRQLDLTEAPPGASGIQDGTGQR